MKTLEKFLTTNPSYLKWGTERLAKRMNLAISTVERFKKTEKFKTLNASYRNK